MDITTRIDLLCRSPVIETVTKDELTDLLETNTNIVAYNGFESIGLLDLGRSIIPLLKIKDFQDAKVKYKLFIANWHAWINNRWDGNFAVLYKVSKYMIAGWQALGINVADISSNEEDGNVVDVVYATEVYNREYWRKLLTISKSLKIDALRKALTILGRSQIDKELFSMLLYVPMQIADIFHLGVDICQTGMDQRKANILAREIGKKLHKWKPIAIHHKIIPSLRKVQGRLLRMEAHEDILPENDLNAIFIHDDEETIKKKISQAYCPEKDMEENPVLDIARYIIIPYYQRFKKASLNVRSKAMGELEIVDGDTLVQYYRQNQITPQELKEAVTNSLIKIISPVAKEFEKNPRYRRLYNELREIIKANMNKKK